jgi:hypothetical protein
LDHRGADRPQQHPGEPAAVVAVDDGARKSARSSESLTWMANSVRGDAAYRLQFETPFKTAARRLRTGRRSSSPDASQLTGAPTTPIPTSAPAHPRTPTNNRVIRVQPLCTRAGVVAAALCSHLLAWQGACKTAGRQLHPLGRTRRSPTGRRPTAIETARSIR